MREHGWFSQTRSHIIYQSVFNHPSAFNTAQEKTLSSTYFVHYFYDSQDIIDVNCTFQCNSYLSSLLIVRMCQVKIIHQNKTQ